MMYDNEDNLQPLSRKNSDVKLNRKLLYVAIPNSTSKYYNVSSSQVYWTSTLYSVSSTVITLPCSWLTEKYGIRVALILTAIFNCLGNAVKIGSIDPSRFYVILLGQALCSVSQSFVFALPSRIAGEWFGANEVSTASAVNIFSLSIGAGLGLLVPTYVVDESVDELASGVQLATLQYGYFGISAAVLLATVIGARNKPPTPPSITTALRNESARNKPPTPPSITTALRMECNQLGQNYFSRIKELLKNKNFDFHLLAFGLNVAVDFILLSVTSDVGLKFFPHNIQDFGWIGFWLNIIGCPASLLAGYIMDKTRLYKEGDLLSYAIYLICLIVMEVMFYIVPSVYFLYIPTLLIGICMAAYISIGFEFGVELAYPEIESIVCGMLFTVAQMFVLILMSITTYLGETFKDKKDIVLFCSMIILLTIGFVFQAFVKPDYKRQLAEKTNTEQNSSDKTVSTIF